MIKKLLITQLAALSMLSVSAFGGGPGWMTDFEAAKKKAASENKDLLLEFTGSDWCPPCKKLSANVFSKQEFVDEASKKFVLVALDYPRRKQQDPAEKAQNAMLSGRYAVNAFPTVILCDASGAPYGKAGFQSGGPAEYNTMLDGLIPQKAKRDEKFAVAAKLEGSEKAVALEEALKSFSKEASLPISAAFDAQLEEIIKADPADKSGFASKILLVSELSSLGADADVKPIFAKLDEYVAKRGLEGQEKQEMLVKKVDAYYARKNFDEMLKAVDEVIAVDPESRMGKMLANAKPRIEKMAEKAQSAE